MSFYRLSLLVESDDEAFARGILSTPNDPSPLLVYADYLEEKGDNRGQVLRALASWHQDSENVSRLDILYRFAFGRPMRYSSLSYTIDLYRKLVEIFPWCKEWLKKNANLFNMLMPELSEEVLDYLLHDVERVDDEGNHWLAFGSYSFMDENGMNIGYADFTMTIPKNDPTDIDLEWEEGVDADEYGPYDYSEMLITQAAHAIQHYLELRNS